MCEAPETMWSYRTLRASGLSRRRLADELAAGSLVRARRGVYVAEGACDDLRAAAMHGGVLACTSAARHLGLWVLGDERTHVWMRGGGHRYAHPGCRCVEHWDASDVPRLTQPDVSRVLRQILACDGVEAFFVALESALRQGMLTTAARRWLEHHVNEEGRDAIRFARDDADSGLESLLRWRLRRYGLTVRTQVDVFGVGCVDALIGDRLIVELDGRENHDSPSHRHKDLYRDAMAALWGYRSLRFDYALVLHDWPVVEAAILAALQD